MVEDKLAFVTWSDETADREDPEFYDPELLALERRLARTGAVRLESLAELLHRAWSPSETDNSFLYIDIASVNTRTGDIQPVEIPEREAPSRARQKVQAGEVLVSTVRPERNAVAIISNEYDGAICSTGFAVLRPLGPVDSFALYAFLKSSYFIAQAMRRCTASMYPAVAEDSLRDVLVPKQLVDNANAVSAKIRKSFEMRNKFLNSLREANAFVNEIVNGSASASYQLPDFIQ